MWLGDVFGVVFEDVVLDFGTSSLYTAVHFGRVTLGSLLPVTCSVALTVLAELCRDFSVSPSKLSRKQDSIGGAALSSGSAAMGALRILRWRAAATLAAWRRTWYAMADLFLWGLPDCGVVN